MEQPKYSINELVEALKNPDLGWWYKDQEDEDSFYSGEVFEIINWIKKPTEIEIKGNIIGNQFNSRDGNFQAIIQISMEEHRAVAVQCLSLIHI